MNKDWPRWIWASLTTYFTSKLNPLFIEGFDRNTNAESDFYELRINGPVFHELTKDQWLITIDVNVLVTSTKDQNDAYKVHRLVGVAAEAFIKAIAVMRYGDDPDEQIGCFALSDDGIIITNFGQIDVDVNVLQSTIEATYSMELNNGTN